MSPFTGDSAILTKLLAADSGIWKDLHGTIESIRIFDRKEATPKDSTRAFTIEIKTDESVVQGGNSELAKSCTGTYRVEATAGFTPLKLLSVKKLKLDCLK